MRSHHWISAPRRAERDRLRADLALPPVLAEVSAHQNLRGPYTAVGTMLRQIGPDIIRERPELAHRHRVELQETTPELADLVPAIPSLLEKSGRKPASVTRYPNRLHTLRVTHGLIDFLETYLGELAGGPRTLIVEDVHYADPTDQEFLAVLLRRISPDLLTVVIATGADLPAELPGTRTESLPQALLRYTARTTGTVTDLTSADAWADTERMGCDYVISDGTDDDPALITAYDDLDPVRRAKMHDIRATQLAMAAESEPSLRLGALPYHLERGSNRATAGVEALRFAQTRSKQLGFYRAAVSFGERGLRLVDPKKNQQIWWAFTRDTAVSLASAGRPEEAATLHDIARRTTLDPLVHMKLAYETGMLYARHFAPEKRDPAIARAWINQAIAIAALLEDPEERTFFSVFNRSGLALVATRTGDTDEALRLLNEGMDMLDQDMALDGRSWCRVGLRYNRAQVNTMRGKLDEALADYDTVIDLDEDFSDHYFNRGNILRRMGRTEEALADYERAQRLEAPFPEVHFNIADARLELGDLEGALAEFDRTLVLEPENVDALLNRAGIHADLGDRETALHDVETGLALAPNHARLLSLKGRLLAEQGLIVEALDTLTAAVTSDPKLAEAWGLRGEVEFGRGDLERARADFDQAIGLGDSPEMRFNRGLVHEAAGDFALAAADFEAVLASGADAEADAHYNSCVRAGGLHAERAGV